MPDRHGILHRLCGRAGLAMRYMSKRKRMRMRPDKYLWHHASQWFSSSKWGVDNHSAMGSSIYTQEIDSVSVSTLGSSDTKTRKE
jgi:hypothetical protein